MSSLKAYGKVNEADQAKLEAQRRTRRRITIISLSTVVLTIVIVAAVVGTSIGSNGKSKSRNSDDGTKPIANSIKAICKVTLYPDSCYSSLSQATNSSQLDPETFFKLSVQVAMGEVSKASESISKHRFKALGNNMTIAALENCNQLLALSIDQFNNTLSSGNVTLLEAIDDLKTWLSAAGTYQQTCIDGFENKNGEVTNIVAAYLKNSTEYASNSLAIVTGLSNAVSSIKLRRLMSYEPRWLTSKDRRLLTSSSLKTKADIIVAKDGSSKYKTINAALKAVPEKSKKRFVIYVKKGIYYENVRVEKPKWNVVMVGDGMNSTVVSGNRNVVDGTPTFSTATFAVFGKGFMARDMGFFNNAGAIKHQAVALMSSADQTAFYRCRIDAFQDSLYTHAQRQLYVECDIYGTVDFIFGNAAVVLQNCNIRPRVPMLGQQNTMTAQGKVDPNQNTGIVIQNCTIAPFGNLTSVKTYLGRPWKPYSTTIIMHSVIGRLIDPAGWMPWNGTSAPDTIFYSEFENSGPGSSTKNRVKWRGLKTITLKQVQKFSVKSFIDGEKWIPTSDITYKSGI